MPASLFRALEAMTEQLKRRRRQLGMTLGEVCRRAEFIDAPALSRLENGKNANPTVETLARVAEALGGELVLQFRVKKTRSRKKRPAKARH